MRKENQVPKYRYVYLIINNINNKTYIGQHSPGVNEEFNSYYGSGKLIQRALKKYGKENFSKIILFEKENITIEEISEIEKYYISLARFEGKAEYNIGFGGEGWNQTGAGRYANTPIQREKASKHLSEFNRVYWKGRKRSKESIEKSHAFWSSQKDEDLEKQNRCKKASSENNIRTWKIPEIREKRLQNMKKNNPALSSKFKKGRKWYHNEFQEFFTVNCPEGCIPGRLSKLKESNI